MDKIDNQTSERRWLAAALAVAACYSAMALRLAFASADLVQDDARQHVFWMARFRDSTLFPHDLIANYFQAVAPAGYKAIYWVFAKLGVEPLLLSRLLPAVIGILTAYLAFRFFLRLTKDARGAFFASVLLCQLVWFKNDVISATPRAFVYPLFLAFLLFLLQRRVLLCLLMLALEGLIYPQAAFVSAGVLIFQLIKLQDRHLVFSRERADYFLALGGLAVLAAVLIPFASTISEFGPVITRAQASALPEFLKHGRSQFFIQGAGFWLTSARSGLWPGAIPSHIIALAIAGALLLFVSAKVPQRGTLRTVALTAIGLWAAAHLLLFKLHLPARYSQWVFRILIGTTAAIALSAAFDAVKRSRLISALLVGIAAAVIAFPAFAKNFPYHSYVGAQPKALFEFLRTRPKESLIATLRDHGSTIPVFAQRSVLVSAEHAIPYHQGYYRLLRERGQDLVRAHLTADPIQLRAFIEKYHVDLIVIGPRPATSGSIKHLRWFREIFPDDALTTSSQTQPVLWNFAESCKIWEDKGNIVLDAHLIAQKIAAHENSNAR